MKNRSLKGTIAALLGIAVLSGCGLSSNSMTSGYTSYDSSAGSSGQVEPGLADDGIKVEGQVTSVAQEPSIIRSGDMSLKSANVSKTFDEVKVAVIAAGGRVENSSFSAANDYSPAAGYVIARIPEPKLDAAIETISSLATRTSLNLSTTDVTLQTVDLKAKIKALTASRDRLLTLMANAKNTADLIAAEQALAQRQSELDSYQGQLDYLSSQVAESTLTIAIESDVTSVTQGLRGFKATILQAARNFLQAFENVVLFIAAVIPWILILGGLFYGIRAIVRRIRRRQSATENAEIPLPQSDS